MLQVNGAGNNILHKHNLLLQQQQQQQQTVNTFLP